LQARLQIPAPGVVSDEFEGTTIRSGRIRSATDLSEKVRLCAVKGVISIEICP
jgi:hypothetical protein